MRKIYLSILAIVCWTMMSVAAFAIDVIVVSHGQANDPFWSVAPIPIAIYVALWPESTEINLEKVILILIPVMYWALRLTTNWIRDWGGLEHEDFRYINLKAKPFAFLIDLFGIHIYPTLQVNLSLFPIYYALSVSTNEVGILSLRPMPFR